jgi:hypothetical protein
MRKFRLNKILSTLIFLYFTVLACTYQKRSNNFFKFYAMEQIPGFLGLMLKP